MNVQQAQANKREWLGVTIVLAGSKRGQNAKLATIAIFGAICFLLLVQFGLPYFFDGSYSGDQLLDPRIFWPAFAFFAICGWLASFSDWELKTLAGKAITLNTEIGPRDSGEVISEMARNLYGGGPFPSAMRNIRLGQIITSPTGIEGEISIRWDKIDSIQFQEPSTLIVNKKELFSEGAELLGLNPVVLRFKTEDDARGFEAVSNEYLTRA
jgi:hypothetical protein